MRRIDVAERRARLARRHRIAPGERAGDVVDAARSVVCLHGTDPAAIYLSAWARTENMTVADLDRALYADRSLVKHLCMRRTLFVVPRETLGAVQAGAADRVAAAERRRLIRDVERAGLHADGEGWLDEACRQVLTALAGGREAKSTELRAEIPLLEGSILYGEGKSWGGKLSIGPRVLTVLSAAGPGGGAANDGARFPSRPRRAVMGGWLRAGGPWGVEPAGQTGFLRPDAPARPEPVEPWAALLPPLDPTTMGWYERGWYLGPHKEQIFDTAGNAGPTVWWHGRIVGGWRQDEGGAVELQMLEDVGADGLRSVEREAERLDRWLDGTRVLPRFPSPLFRRARI